MPKQLFKFTIILLLILLSTSLIAQIDTTKADKGVNINFFNGYAISYKWNTNQDMSYRIYLGMNSSWTNSESESDRGYDYNSSTQQAKYYHKSNSNDNSIYFNSNLSFQFLFDLASKESYNLYLGIGPNISYSYRKSNNNNSYNESSTQGGIYNSTSNYESSNITHSFGIGIISLIGIEAFITKNISLFAESHIIAKRTWGKKEYLSIDNDTHNGAESRNENYDNGTVSSWNANLQLVKVGLGIYF